MSNLEHVCMWFAVNILEVGGYSVDDPIELDMAISYLTLGTVIGLRIGDQEVADPVRILRSAKVPDVLPVLDNSEVTKAIRASGSMPEIDQMLDDAGWLGAVKEMITAKFNRRPDQSENSATWLISDSVSAIGGYMWAKDIPYEIGLSALLESIRIGIAGWFTFEPTNGTHQFVESSIEEVKPHGDYMPLVDSLVESIPLE